MLKKIILSALVFTALIPTQSFAGTHGFGVEGYRDNYKVDAYEETKTTNFGAVTAYYQGNINKKTFVAFDARVAYGSQEYEAKVASPLGENPLGKVGGVPQWEMEFRARFGLTMPLWGGSFSPYTGVGIRYQRDEGKGYLTDQLEENFDTRTLQWYIPIGASLAFQTSDGWTITPQVEVSVSPAGYIDKRITAINFGTIQYLDPSSTNQSLGFGARSELMFGKSFGNYAWQIGPFIRYWNYGKSSNTEYTIYTGPSTSYQGTISEPSNSRTQAGIAVRVLW